MRIDRELAALAADPTPIAAHSDAQQAAVDRWRAAPQARAVLDALDAFGAGAALEACPALRAAMRGEGRARLVGPFLSEMMAAIAAGPLGQARLLTSSAGAMHRLTLASAGRALLSFALVDGDALARGRAGLTPRAVFQPGETHLLVLSGTAEARRVRLLGGELRRREVAHAMLALAPGDALAFDSGDEALDLLSVRGSLVTLRLHRRPADAPPIREYDLDSGELVHQSAGDARESRLTMAMLLLGRMGRRDAAPAIASLATGQGSETLRWQALREALALDAGEGYRTLLAVARAPADPLAPAARRLAGELAARHPALASMQEDAACLA